MPVEKRAYTDEEKYQREQKIVDAAQTLLMEKNYTDINMSEIARQANLAKGTVYLYFQTKEELFLTLFERKLQDWFERVQADLERLTSPAVGQDVVEILVRHIIEDRHLVKLAALTNIIFEHNITYEKARDYKVWLNQAVLQLGTVLDGKLTLATGQGAQVLYRMYVFIIGLENVANPAPISREVYAKELTLSYPDFEDELRSLMTLIVDAL